MFSRLELKYQLRRKEASTDIDRLNIIKKQLSDVTDNLKGESDSSSSGASSDSIDPIEKLASSDPAARIIKPVTPEQSKSTVNTDSQTPASTKADETEKPDKTNE